MKDNNKVTAVDTLKSQFLWIMWLLNRDEVSKEKADELMEDAFKKAKQLEKDQIVEAAGKKYYKEKYEK